jgi:hypothetical protein
MIFYGFHLFTFTRIQVCAFQFDADPDPAFHSDADPTKRLCTMTANTCIQVRNAEK